MTMSCACAMLSPRAAGRSGGAGQVALQDARDSAAAVGAGKKKFVEQSDDDVP